MKLEAKAAESFRVVGRDTEMVSRFPAAYAALMVAIAAADRVH
jgi:hypothetical protein